MSNFITKRFVVRKSLIGKNVQFDFTKYNKQNEFIIYSYITDHFPTLINILKSNDIKYTLLTDEFNTDFIII